MNVFKNLFREVSLFKNIKTPAFAKYSTKGAGARDVITLFHKPSVPSSVRALTLLKQATGTAQSTATEDQASSHDTHSKAQRTDFELEVTQEAPTGDQFQNMLEYIGKHNVSKLIQGARDEGDALKRLRENAENFQRPVVCPSTCAEDMQKLICDFRWWTGTMDEQVRAFEHGSTMSIIDSTLVAGDDQSEILNLLRTLPKETTSV